jgi:hypothetical protein
MRSITRCLQLTKFLVAFSVPLTLASVVAPQKADAQAKLYITIQATETNTTVGQQPKLVLTYGNIGNTRFVFYFVACGSFTGQNIGFQNFTFTRSNLIPGQNANWEHPFRAVGPGTAEISCTVNGLDLNGNQVSAGSNIVTINVKEQ